MSTVRVSHPLAGKQSPVTKKVSSCIAVYIVSHGDSDDVQVSEVFKVNNNLYNVIHHLARSNKILNGCEGYIQKALGLKPSAILVHGNCWESMIKHLGPGEICLKTLLKVLRWPPRSIARG